jgi:two-component system, OmpR family, sensor kinase
MKRFLPGMLAALGVALLGFVIGGLAEWQALPNPLFAATYKIDLAGLATRAGILLGGLVVVAALVLWGMQRMIERKQAEEQAAQVSARQRFFQRLDHEMKNPLTIIRLGLVNLQQGPNLNAKQTGSLERVSQQVQRLQKLVVDLRLLSELDQGSIECKPVDLRELLEESIALSSQALEPVREVILSVQQKPWPISNVWGDRDLLVLVFRNLLDNALKFTLPEDQVEVRVTEDGRVAIVEVVDTGPGIPGDEIPHIFEELYRGENARGIPGSGLGLKLVERIVVLHDGAVQVRSKPEMGTVFTIRLPLAPDGA